ncbi:Hsp33 protein [Thioalkalivibrio sp. K90mix]|uniref:Hsp33 family molecular chaperone HslO n=1 Tax=Thioalkalivibrio sp. (strain K90mix) TaxID=396595 RepID=UPI000195A8E3|nr:Hsp33 family molecular chaperone HslO [Thioalkalivibrio sp. K90mix]ADC70849.1 Hsp33 protein [Thioalkalivibrio sp. K90mix]
MREPDTLHRFMLEEAGVRGEWVHLDAAWQALLERHEYPPVVRDLLGQAYAAVALTAATLKFDGSLILQVTGTGPVHMIVAQADGQGRLRGLARFRETPPEGATLAECAGDNARLMLTLDPGDGGERYQGVVELEGETLADAMNVYFERSEQLPTRLWLAANQQSAAGMLLQAVPGEGGHAVTRDPEDWNRANILADTTTPEEMLELDAGTLLGRLFAEERVRLFDGTPVQFHCPCSRERVSETLRGLGQDEIRGIIEEQGQIEVTCEFCNAQYHFDPVDAEALCATQTVQPPTPDTRQ